MERVNWTVRYRIHSGPIISARWAGVRRRGSILRFRSYAGIREAARGAESFKIVGGQEDRLSRFKLLTYILHGRYIGLPLILAAPPRFIHRARMNHVVANSGVGFFHWPFPFASTGVRNIRWGVSKCQRRSGAVTQFETSGSPLVGSSNPRFSPDPERPAKRLDVSGSLGDGLTKRVSRSAKIRIIFSAVRNVSRYPFKLRWKLRYKRRALRFARY